MGSDRDIEEKFKKDVSKEISNLKEFLIQQGKEIVKIKQENKALKDLSSKGDGGGTGLSPEIKIILDKQQVALEKQKENTTKLSKLCLGTLNELEKLEKQQQEKQVDIRTEEKIKRLTEENRKLIHLVTALDQQLSVLETKIEKNARPPSSQEVGTQGGVSREEVSRIVRDNLQPLQQDNNQRDGQIQSLITEVQNVIGQNREAGILVKEVSDKVRRIEQLDTNEKFGLELASAVSRLEKIERDLVVSKGREAAGPKLTSIEADVAKQREAQQAEVARQREAHERLTAKVAEVEGLVKLNTDKGKLEAGEKIATLGTEVQKLRTEARDLKANLGKVDNVEEKLSSIEAEMLRIKNDSKDFKNSLTRVEKSLQSSDTKSAVEDLARQVEKLKKEEEDARNARKNQNIFSADDVKRMNDAQSGLEDKVFNLQKSIDLEKIENKASNQKLKAEQELITEKLKTISVSMKDEKLKCEEKFSQIDNLAKSADQSADLDKQMTSLKSTVSKLEQSLKSCEDTIKKSKTEVSSLSSEVKTATAAGQKAGKAAEEVGTKLFDCIHDYETVKDSVDKLSKKIDRRPAAEELDKKSELTNKLYNDLSTKIEEVEGSLQKEVKKVKTDLEKMNSQVQRLSSTGEETSTAFTRETKVLKDELNSITSSISEMKSSSAGVKSECDKLSKSVSGLTAKLEDVKKEVSGVKTEAMAAKNSLDKLKAVEKEIDTLKKDKSSDKVTSVEKELLSLRADHEKCYKDLKSLSTEVKYLDSTMKKETANTKTELAAFSKTVKGYEKDINTFHNMVDVLKDEAKGSGDSMEEITSLKSDIKKMKTDITTCDKKVTDTKDEINRKIQMEMKDNDNKMTKIKEEMQGKITSCTNDLKTLEKKVEAGSAASKQAPDTKEIDAKIKQTKEELSARVEAASSQWKEEVGVKLTLSDTKLQKMKEDLLAKAATSTAEAKALEKKIESLSSDMKKIPELQTKLGKQEESFNKLVKTVETLETSSKSAKTESGNSASLKKEVDKINQEIKDSLSKWESKLTSQETQVSQVKTAVKDVAEKIVKLEKPDKSSDDSYKKELEKTNQLIKDNKKSLEDKLTTQENKIKEFNDKLGKLEKSSAAKPAPDNSGLKKEVETLSGSVKENQKTVDKSLKEITDKIVKLEKNEGSAAKSGGETSKLTTLSKAIDTIQENSKTLETMVKKMKTEFSTPKDLEKLKTELKNTISSAGGGGGDGGVDMGPIMESLIMTNDRPYVDCSTLTPMTGNGLIKFERFNAMNKLPWDDHNDQFVIQEPGVYVVFVTAILQDAALSIKIASNMLEREVCCVGSREGLVGSAAPAFVSRTALFQIEDDDNVCETILVEIHADNDDSFVDKNVTLTLYKIAESTPGD